MLSDVTLWSGESRSGRTLSRERRASTAALDGAGYAHGSPSLPLNHTVGHAIGRRLAATAPGVSKGSHTERRSGSITAGGAARVTAPDRIHHQEVCMRVGGGERGGSQRVGQM